MTYQDLKEASEVFGLGERATLAQIKARHRELVKAHHPDRNKTAGPEVMRRINRANELLMEYCGSYHFCFSEEEFVAQTPTERIRRQFAGDPVWGGPGVAEQD